MTSASAPSALQADWTSACRRAAARLGEVLAKHPTTSERAVVAGRGRGGDDSLVIDLGAEEAVFAELERLHAEGHAFSVVSEERGEVDFGDSEVRVIVDPIDGSLNAKRGLAHHAISIAVADGPTMADVAFGFVYESGSGEEWIARRDEGAWLDGSRITIPGPEERRVDGKLEIVGIESADPRWVAEAADGLTEHAHRLRALGSIAVSLCQVAAARFDGMLSLKRCRAFDAAAAQLVVREAGGLVAFTACDEPLGAPLDLAPRSPVVAARTESALRALATIPKV